MNTLEIIATIGGSKGRGETKITVKSDTAHINRKTVYDIVNALYPDCPCFAVTDWKIIPEQSSHPA